ncbi:uncharacterized protein BX663DRAFT_515938, partial [Cokeromyces recurvatus]|uniref:uncharacterized protein n=1 Tax=Cokeromyces recurvatus TaxID=90255 RepID=UPI00221E7DAF
MNKLIEKSFLIVSTNKRKVQLFFPYRECWCNNIYIYDKIQNNKIKRVIIYNENLLLFTM